jgi:hypothetical protein
MNYVYESTEVCLTGRTASKAVGNRIMTLYEITNEIKGAEDTSSFNIWKKWVLMDALFQIQEPKK